MEDAIGGKPTAIFGLGRSGLSVARAITKRGGKTILLESAPEMLVGKQELVEEYRALGQEAVFGWDGNWSKLEVSEVVVNPAVDSRSPILQSAVEAGIPVIGEIEYAYRITKAPIIAITGTNGKSTTTAMIWSCLKGAGEKPILCGNIFGSGFAEKPLTEAADEADEDSVLVAEISSFQLEWVHEFCPVVSVVTNITQDHLNRYNSFEDYAATKKRIWARQSSAHYTIVRANDPVVGEPGKEITGVARRLRAFAGEATPKNLPTVWKAGATGEQALVEEQRSTIFERIVDHGIYGFLGHHNRTNAAMAILASYAFLKWKGAAKPGSNADQVVSSAIQERQEALEAKRTRFSAYRAPVVDWVPQTLVDPLRTFPGLEHRMEVVGKKGDTTVVNNSMCTNPAAVLSSINALNGTVSVLIGGVNKDLDFRPLKSLFASRRYRVYLYGQDGESIRHTLGAEGETYRTLRAAFQAAVNDLDTGIVNSEFLMLAPGCASMDEFRDFRHRGDVFKELAKEWLQ